MDTKQLKSLLAGLPLGEIRYAEQLSSTNEAAMMWLATAASAPDLSLVVADEQTAGRGRFNRRWVTRPGAALAAKFIAFVASPQGQKIIQNYGRDRYGEGLYNIAAYARQYEK